MGSRRCFFLLKKYKNGEEGIAMQFYPVVSGIPTVVQLNI